MPFTIPFEIPFDIGLGSSFATDPISRGFDIGIAGRGYLVDWNPENPYRRRSGQKLKQQTDDRPEPGEQSIGDGWWRRTQSDFSGGQGQKWMDRPQSNRTRFLSSKGLDVFTEAPEAQLLHTTQEALDSSSTNLALQRAEDGSTVYTYLADNQTLKRTANPFAGPPATWTTITGTPAVAISSITSSGQYVYIAYGTDIYRSAVSGTTAASWSTQDATLVRWAKQRIMGANANILYEFDSSGTATARHTHWNPAWTWTDIVEIGPSILASGYIGEKSTVFRFNANADGTLGSGIDAVDGGLPDGEIIYAMYSYAGFVFLGTNRGVRMCSHDAEGNLTFGPPTPEDTTISVRCFEPEGPFMWFGWTNYDATSTGLGRLDLRTFVRSLQPACATDLMATEQGTVLSVVSHSDKRVFAVSGKGIYAESTTYVASGTLTTSRIGYGIAADKVAKFLEINQVPNGGEIGVSIAGSDDSFTTLGECTDNFCEITVGSKRSPALSLRFVVTAVSGQLTTPIFRDYTLKSLPTYASGRIIRLPILLFDSMENRHDQEIGYPGYALEQLEYLELLEDSGDTVRYEDITTAIRGESRSFDVEILELDFIASQSHLTGEGFGGVCNVTVRVTG